MAKEAVIIVDVVLFMIVFRFICMNVKRCDTVNRTKDHHNDLQKKCKKIGLGSLCSKDKETKNKCRKAKRGVAHAVHKKFEVIGA